MAHRNFRIAASQPSANELHSGAWRTNRPSAVLFPRPDESTFGNEIEAVARKLKGNGPAIFRYLAENSQGVSFSQFKAATNDVTGFPLTQSEDTEVIASMLRRYSTRWQEYGWRISCRPRMDLIRLEKIGPNRIRKKKRK